MAGSGLSRLRVAAERRSAPDPWINRVIHHGGAENPRGSFVLYWCQSARRMVSNLALDYAIARANDCGVPVVVFESLRTDYPGANDRLHAFVLEGVAANIRDAAARGVSYHFFLPRSPDEARGVVRQLAAEARIVVTDDYPTFVVRDHVERFARKTPVALFTVDANGMFPMRAFEKEMYSAKILRDRAVRLIDALWSRSPELSPRATRAFAIDLPKYDGLDPRGTAASLPIDHGIGPVRTRGGRDSGLEMLRAFIETRLARYDARRNRDADATSELSPYLHFGFLSIHEIVAAVYASGAPAADIDAFLEQAVIRRELSFNMCHHRKDHDSLSALPEWARRTLDAHRTDRRKPLYDAATLEAGTTHDEVWNLAQNGLRAEGTIHNYLRMLWGKKIIEWSATPEAAHALMIDLHERWAIDGRDPNTHAGVLWCFGKHDRPWAPERPIFGSIRWMSSDATKRKVDLAAYARRVSSVAPATAT